MNRDRQFDFHFTPREGWINDPNGLIYAEGKYHLFFQYNPDAPVWGPMHWGHAVSEDLANWQQLDNAILPEKKSYAFSGSAIGSKRAAPISVNEASFSTGPLSPFAQRPSSDSLIQIPGGMAGPFYLLYTSHNPESGEQQQCLVKSEDLEHFESWEKNPVIKNSKDSPDFKKEFRDPKIFPNVKIHGYTAPACGLYLDNIEY